MQVKQTQKRAARTAILSYLTTKQTEQNAVTAEQNVVKAEQNVVKAAVKAKPMLDKLKTTVGFKLDEERELGNLQLIRAFNEGRFYISMAYPVTRNKLTETNYESYLLYTEKSDNFGRGWVLLKFKPITPFYISNAH